MCSICFEENNEKIMFSKIYSYECFYTDCPCNLPIHKSCLDVWSKINKKCFLCKKDYKRVEVSIENFYTFEVFCFSLLIQVNLVLYQNDIFKFFQVLIHWAVLFITFYNIYIIVNLFIE